MKLEYGTWSCGCEGFRVNNGASAWLTSACDSTSSRDIDIVQASDRHIAVLEKKTFTPSRHDMAVNFMYALSSLVDDGYNFRTIRDLIR